MFSVVLPVQFLPPPYCQDAIKWHNGTRPILALSDGAGSAAVSELGARALVTGIPRLLASLEDSLIPWLDEHRPQACDEITVIWMQRLLTHARGLLDDLADAERRSVRDLRATLLIAIIGRIHTFWMQVGDGAIVVRQNGSLRALGIPEKAKGEFANQTCFVDSAAASDVQSGLLPTAELSGIALMSDGGSEKLVASDGSRVAPRLGTWLDETARGSLSPDRIALAYHDPAMWERTSLDDRSIVLAARLDSSPSGSKITN